MKDDVTYLNIFYLLFEETFSALLDLCQGKSPVSGGFLSQRPVTRSFVFFLDIEWANACENSRVAADLSRYLAHYDVIVMTQTGQVSDMHYCAIPSRMSYFFHKNILCEPLIHVFKLQRFRYCIFSNLLRFLTVTNLLVCLKSFLV